MNHVDPSKSSSTSPPTEAQWLISNGFFPIRLDPGTKGPNTKGWNTPTERIAVNADLKKLFPEGHNLGVLTGDTYSNGLRDIDLDCPEAVSCAAKMLPATAMVWGKDGERRHYGYLCSGLPTQRFRDPNIPDGDERSMLVEIRGDKLQTMVPPSVHPDGGTIQWVSREYPPQIEPAVLLTAVKRLAAAALIARCWPGKGSRHAFTLAMAGWLSQHLEQDVCCAILIGAARAARCTNLPNKLSAIRDTYTKLEKDQQTTGLPTAKSLSPRLTPEAIKRLEEWLGIKHIIPILSTPASSPSAPSADPLVPPPWGSWKAMDVSEFKAWSFPPIEFIVDGLLPSRGLAWIGGRAKRGKSLFMLYLCLAIAAGRAQVLGYFDISVRPKILYLAREDAGGRVQERIGDIVAQWPDEIPKGAMVVYVRPKGFNLGSPEHMNWVREQCRLFGYSMVVFDTWTALSPGHDPLGAQAQTELAQAVARFTEDLEGCTVVIDHSRKNRPEGTTLGSADILGPSQKWQAAETVIMLADTKESGRIEVFMEGKDLDEARFFMVVSPRGSTEPGVEKFTFVGTAADQAASSTLKGGMNCQKVLDAIEAEKTGLVMAQLTERTNLSEATVKRHLATLREAKRIMSDPMGHGHIPWAGEGGSGGSVSPSEPHDPPCSTAVSRPEAGPAEQGVLPHVDRRSEGRRGGLSSLSRYREVS